MTKKKHFRIVVLGAGFARPAGLLLADELFAEIRSRATLKYGPTNAIESDLEYFITYKQRCEGTQVSKEDVDYEEFLGFLNIEHALGFRGSDTITSEGNQTQLIAKKLIGQIIYEKMLKCLESIPTLYLDFARRLQPSDWVLTFNYDTLLERALEAVGTPFRRFPTRYEEVHPLLGYGVSDDSQDEVVILKLHGSIDWFDKTPYDEAKKVLATVDPNCEPRWYSHFSPDSGFEMTPLLEGIQMPDDPLHRIYRMVNYDSYYSQSHIPQPPFILTPSSGKVLYFEALKPLWWGIGEAGGLNLGMTIIGYSVPPHDEHARQAVYRLTNNYTEFEPNLELAGIRKSPLKLLNLAHNKHETQLFKSRYRFVNWDRAEVWLHGFNKESLDFIFSEGC